MLFQGDASERCILSPPCIAVLVSILGSPAAYPSAAIRDALLLVIYMASTPDGCRRVIDSGGVGALLSLLKCGPPPEPASLAAAAVLSLTASAAVARAEGAADALVTILRLPDPKQIQVLPALHALAELMSHHRGFDPEICCIDAPQAVISWIDKIWGGHWGGFPISLAENSAAQHARAALCHFAARSLENAKAVFRGSGVPALVAVLVDGLEPDRAAAAEALRFMAAEERRIAV